MCIAIPGKVISIEGRKATVQYPGVENPAMIGEDSVRIGDMVMVQMGIITRVLTKSEAKELQQAWTEKKH